MSNSVLFCFILHHSENCILEMPEGTCMLSDLLPNLLPKTIGSKLGSKIVTTILTICISNHSEILFLSPKDGVIENLRMKIYISLIDKLIYKFIQL